MITWILFALFVVVFLYILKLERKIEKLEIRANVHDAKFNAIQNFLDSFRNKDE